ncbi:nucleoside hydrolase [Aliiglaciecola litoralis]|uniref:Nucleoside hydrolase n=1 Tax=Aliiglaciecola litoralis TaxID=582857 RepID=A0ABP3WVH8_9ALTE
MTEQKQQQAKQKVIFDHDGGVDDLLSLMLLLTMEHIELLAVTITPADCYLSDATLSTLKILNKMDRTDVLVAKGSIHGVNPFPADWRAQPKICNALPDMILQPVNLNQISELPADQVIASLLEQHQQVDILMTGPCSNLTACLAKHPELKSHIQQVIWMGGAVDVPGNVAMHNHDKSAEWNAFWDPMATQALIESGLVVKMISLDATNCLPVDMTFLAQLAQQRAYPLSHLAGQFWATTINSIPSYEYTYFMWDVLATSVLGVAADAIEFSAIELAVSITEPNAGQTYRAKGSGNEILVATGANKQLVLDYVLRQFKG